MKHWLALLLALCLPFTAAFAQEDVLPQVQPLMDIAAAAVMTTGQAVAPDVTLSGDFCAAALAAARRQGVAADGEGFLTGCFAAAHEAIPAELPQPADYYGVRPMAMDESEDGTAVRVIGDVYCAADALDRLTDEQYAQVKWLDQRAVVELRRSAGAPMGWKVYSFALDAEWEMEQAAQDYFTANMVEYVNTEWGFSMQYPAVFGEDSVRMDENGVSGAIEGASFRVERLPNDDAWTLDALLAAKKQETPDAEANIMDIAGCARLVQYADGKVQVTIFAVTDAYVYQATMTYDQSLSKDFTLYSDYMMNSFTVDELGLG